MGEFDGLAAPPALATNETAGSSFLLERVSSNSMAKAIYKFAFVMALSLAVVTSASAQRRGFSMPMRGVTAPTRGVTAPTRGVTAPMRGFAGRSPSGLQHGFSRPGRVEHRILVPGSCVTTGPCPTVFFQPPVVTATPLEPNFGLINGVSGLGFDFPHLAAINRGFNSQFAFFNALNNGFFNNGFFPFFTPVFFDPFAFSGAGVIPEEVERQPIFVMTQPPQPQPAPAPPPEAAPRAPAAEPQAPPPPPPELGQLILVRSDGQVLLAVAFTVRNGQLTYITNDGTRRSFPASELDKDATRQMNDANGTSVSLPN